MRAGTLLAIGVAAVVATSIGCVAPSTLDFGQVGILSPDYGETPIEILAIDVVAEDCIPTTESRRPSYGRAVASAISSVPNANVMKDVSFTYQDRLTSLCVIIEGQVGRFE